MKKQWDEGEYSDLQKMYVKRQDELISAQKALVEAQAELVMLQKQLLEGGDHCGGVGYCKGRD